MKKMRADQLLCERGHFETPEEAARFIMAGKVRFNKDMLLRKPGELIAIDEPLIVESELDYVSRGAYKLKDVLEAYLPSLSGLTALDIGASTGGFTDLMLRMGAEKVYAADVGRGLLHGKLRNDSRVVVVEGVNAKLLCENEIPEKVDIVTMDVSFISSTKVLPAADRLMKSGAMAFILVKPQFEAPRELVPPGGVIRDEKVRAQMIEKVVNFAVDSLKWRLDSVTPSPIKGPKGNQEYIAFFKKEQV